MKSRILAGLQAAMRTGRKRAASAMQRAPRSVNRIAPMVGHYSAERPTDSVRTHRHGVRNGIPKSIAS